MYEAAEPQPKKSKTEEKQFAEVAPKLKHSLMTQDEAAPFTVTITEAPDRLQAVIDEYGAAIVTNVLSAEDIKQLEAKLNEDLAELVDVEAITHADGSVASAWDAAKKGVLHWPAAALADVGARGRFQDRGLPHGRFAWAARLHPNVRRVYEILHQSTDLVSSCDNAFVANQTEVEETENKAWPHVDQNDHDPRVSDWTVYQGILYLWSSEKPHASTTVVWPKSHQEMYDVYMKDDNMRERAAQGKAHFSLISGLKPGEARDRLIHGWMQHARRLPIPAGALLLFQSRTTHQGWAGGPRLAQPVCWEPRSRQDAVMRERKLRLAALGLPSTHWASLGLPHELSALKRPLIAEAKGSEHHNEVHLPLRSNIRSVALTDSADVEELWHSLQDLPWMEPLPADAKLLLENSIRPEFKLCL